MEFVSAVCPRIDETSAKKDTECIKNLREQVENRNEFGFEITDDNRIQIQKEVDNYCTALFYLSGDFVIPSDAPTPGPNKPSMPSLSPSEAPSAAPSVSAQPSFSPSVSASPTSYQEFVVAFTYMMGFDDKKVHDDVLKEARMDIMDSAADTIRKVVYQRSVFFVDGGARARGRKAKANAIEGVGGRRYLRQGQNKEKGNEKMKQIIDDGHDETPDFVIVDYQVEVEEVSGRNLQKVVLNTDGVEHTSFFDFPCTDAFEISTDCIAVHSQVKLQSSSNIPAPDVKQSVLYSVQSSMDEDVFHELMDEEEVKEVVFMNVGLDPQGPENPIGVGGGSIAGITIGSVLFLVILAFFVGRARARSPDDEEESVDEDDLESESVFEGSDSSSSSSSGNPAKDDDDERIQYIMTTGDEKKKSRDLPAIDEDQRSDTGIMKNHGLQFDPASGQVVGSAARSYASSSYASANSNSGYSADDPDTTAPKDLQNGDELVDQLDAAVHAGDWAAVAAIAGDLSQADDISTMSSYYSRAGDISYDPSDRESLAPEDAERAEKIDKLIAEGDWSAVGATAAAFESETGSHSGSEKSGKKRSIPPLPPSKDDTKKQRGKNIMDFIGGPWQSTAASKAVEQEEQNIVSDSENEGSFTKYTNEDFSNFNNNEVMSLSEPSDLSTGEGPPQSRHGQLVGLGTVGTVGVKAAAAYHSGSETTTDDDTRNLLTAQKKKRTWTGRFFKKGNSDGSPVSKKSLALQEDSSVSSWSRGEDSSPDTTLNLYGIASQSGDNMPAEMRAFGEDHGLEAAELAMQEEAERQQQQRSSDKEGSDGGLSGKSSESLRDELDRAIESGDWAAVEKQTNEMLEVGDGDMGQRRNRSLSDIDSEIDTSDGEGWSAGNQSDYESEAIDDERIEMLEKLIETDDWQGIVDDSQIHTKTEDSVVDNDD